MFFRFLTNLFIIFFSSIPKSIKYLNLSLKISVVLENILELEPVTLKNLPCLKKFVLEETKKMFKELPLFIRYCPNLTEIWLSASFKHGVIQVKNKENEPFKDRFVLQELKDEMNWFQQGEIDYSRINQYFPPCNYYTNSSLDDFSLGSSGGMYYESFTIPKGVWNCHTPLSLFFDRNQYLTLENTKEQNWEYVHYFGYWKH